MLLGTDAAYSAVRLVLMYPLVLHWLAPMRCPVLMWHMVLWQLDMTSTRSYGGTGLGLALVKEMVAAQVCSRFCWYIAGIMPAYCWYMSAMLMLLLTSITAISDLYGIDADVNGGKADIYRSDADINAGNADVNGGGAARDSEHHLRPRRR